MIEGKRESLRWQRSCQAEEQSASWLALHGRNSRHFASEGQESILFSCAWRNTSSGATRPRTSMVPNGMAARLESATCEGSGRRH